MRTARHLLWTTAIIGISLLGSAPGCGGSGSTNGFGGGSSSGGSGSGGGNGSGEFGDDGGGGGGTGGGGPCTGLACQIHSCSGGGSTQISGTVYDPAGKNPLYNVAVYVPNAPLQPLQSGASCYSCGDLYSGDPIASAVTGPDGKFTINNAPDGKNIPLVIQVGKWRKQVYVANAAQCQNTTMPDKSLRLPKNHFEGDMPNIAIATGGADSLECLLERVGVDETEYGGGAGGKGRIHIFQGDGGASTSPAAPTASQALWNSSADLMPFDIVILSCEGHETTAMDQQALFDYAKQGGRVFASHFHYSWFNSGPFGAENLASWTTGSNAIGTIAGKIMTTLPNGQPFPKGQALDQWLGNVNALQNGLLPIQEAKDNANVTAANTPSVPWIIDSTKATSTQYFSFDTPFGVPEQQQCGRVVFSDLHVGSASGDQVGGVTPQSCAVHDLSPQEKALEFMLFDLSSCITPNGQPPQPPQPVQ